MSFIKCYPANMDGHWQGKFNQNSFLQLGFWIVLRDPIENLPMIFSNIAGNQPDVRILAIHQTPTKLMEVARNVRKLQRPVQLASARNKRLTGCLNGKKVNN